MLFVFLVCMHVSLKDKRSIITTTTALQNILGNSGRYQIDYGQIKLVSHKKVNKITIVKQ